MLKVIIYDSLVNFEIYKELYGKPLKHDWVARVVSPIQILLIFGRCCNHYSWDIWLKIDRLPNFNNYALSIHANNIFQKRTVVVFTESFVMWSTNAKGLSLQKASFQY